MNRQTQTDRQALINRLVERKMSPGSKRQALCVCLARTVAVEKRALCFAKK